VVEAGKVPIFLNSIKVQEIQPKVTVEKKADQPRVSDMVEHGFGVYEDNQGDVWYAKDGVIYRNATTEVDKAVQRVMAKRG